MEVVSSARSTGKEIDLDSLQIDMEYDMEAIYFSDKNHEYLIRTRDLHDTKTRIDVNFTLYMEDKERNGGIELLRGGIRYSKKRLKASALWYSTNSGQM